MKLLDYERGQTMDFLGYSKEEEEEDRKWDEKWGWLEEIIDWSILALLPLIPITTTIIYNWPIWPFN